MRKVLTFREVLREELKDKKFKKEYEEQLLFVKVAVEIAKLREKEHMSQKELARRLHTSQQAISRIEKGAQNVSVRMLLKIASVFQMKPEVRFVKAS